MENEAGGRGNELEGRGSREGGLGREAEERPKAVTMPGSPRLHQAPGSPQVGDKGLPQRWGQGLAA